MWDKLIRAGKSDHASGFSPGMLPQVQQELPLLEKQGSLSHFKKVLLY